MVAAVPHDLFTVADFKNRFNPSWVGLVHRAKNPVEVLEEESSALLKALGGLDSSNVAGDVSGTLFLTPSLLLEYLLSNMTLLFSHQYITYR